MLSLKRRKAKSRILYGTCLDCSQHLTCMETYLSICFPIFVCPLLKVRHLFRLNRRRRREYTIEKAMCCVTSTDWIDDNSVKELPHTWPIVREIRALQIKFLILDIEYSCSSRCTGVAFQQPRTDFGHENRTRLP